MDTGQHSQTEMEATGLISNACSPCSENNERVIAAKYCVECKDYYCQNCVDRHNWFPALRNHALYGANDRFGTDIPESSITLMCDIHKTETVDSYCPQHDDVLCAKCLKENHSSCTNVNELAEAARDTPTAVEMTSVVQESLKIGQRLDETVRTLNEEMEHLDKSKDVAIIEIKSYRGELDLSLLRLEGLTIDYLRHIHDKLATALLNERETAENHEFELQHARFQHEIPFASSEQQFVALNQQKKKIRKAKEALNSMTRTGRFEVKFTQDPEIKGLLRHKLALGEIEGVKKANLYTFSHVQKLYVKNTDADRYTCNILGSCITLDGLYLLVSDTNNTNVKRYEVRNCVFKDHCKLPKSPTGICCLNKEEAAVIVFKKGICILSLVDRMRITRIIDIGHSSDDLAYSSGKLYATSYSDNVCMYDLSGQLIKKITTDESGNKIFFNTRHIEADQNEGRIYVTDAKKGLVKLNTNGDHIVTVSHRALKFPLGVCTDGNGCAFVCGNDSKNIFQYNKVNDKLFELVKASSDIGSPQSLCFAESDGRKFIVVTSHFSDYVYRCFLEKSQI